MPDTNAVFQEVLEIKADVPSFVTSLKQIEEEWNAFVSRLGDKAGPAVGVGAHSQLTQLAKDMEQAALAMEQVAHQTEENTKKLDSIQEQAAAKQSKRVRKQVEEEKQAVKEITDAQKAIAEAKRLFADTLDSYDEVEKKRREISIEQEGVSGRGGLAEEKAAASRRNSMYTSDLAAAEALYQQEQKALTVKQQAAILEEKLAGARRNVFQQDLAAAEAIATREEQELKRKAALGSAEERLAASKRDVLNAELKLAEASAARQASQGKIEESLAAQRQRAVFGADLAAMQGVAEREREALENQKKHNTEVGTHNRLVERGRNENRSFWEVWTGGLRGSLIHLTRFALLWGVIQGVMSGIGKVIGMPFKAMIEGVQYLEKMQYHADELTGVLLANVQYSENFAENLNKVRNISRDLVVAFQDVALATHLTEDQVENTFKAMIQAGAGRTVSTLRELVTLSAYFNAAALKAEGVGGLSAQGSINELVKLFNDNVGPGNKWLTTLKLTNDEWQKIRANAIEHGTLLKDLAPRLKPYLDATQQAALGQKVMLQELELRWHRIQADANKPLFDKIAVALQWFNKWLDENAYKIKDLFKTATDQTTAFAKSLWELGKYSGILAVIDIGARALLYTLTGINLALSGSAALLKAVWTITTSRGKDGPLAIAQLKKDWEDMKQLNADANKVIFGRPKPIEEQQKSGLDDPYKNTNSGRDMENRVRDINQGFADARARFFEYVESVREKYSELRSAVNDAVAAQTMTHAQAAEKIKQYNGEEIAAISTRYRDLLTMAERTRRELGSATAAGTATPQERRQAVSAFDTGLVNLNTQVQKIIQSEERAVFAAQRQANAEQVALANSHFKHLLAMRQEAMRQELAIAKALHEEGRLTDLQYLDAEVKNAKDAHDAEIELMDDEARRFVQGSTERLDAEYRILQEQQKYQNQEKAFASERARLIDEETRKRQEHLAVLRQQLLENQLISAQTAETINPSVGYSELINQTYQVRFRELDILEREKKALWEVAYAKNAESETTRKLSQDLEKLQGDRLALFNQQLQDIRSRNANPAIANMQMRTAANQMYSVLSARSLDAQNRLQSFRDNLPEGRLSKEAAAELEKLSKAVQDAAAELGNFQYSVEAIRPSFGRSLNTFIGMLSGVNIKKAWDSASGSIGKFAVGVNIAGGALANLKNIVATWKQGYAEGGIMGGIGAVGSMFGDALSNIPVIGQFMPGIMGALSFIGSMFTAAAKRIAEDVKKQFQRTLDDYQNGNATLISTINALEQQRAQAIVRLSGKKGGREELDKLLPEFDQELVNLRKQQQEILVGFEDSLAVLQLHSETLAQVGKQWADINKQVKDYIGAGGDASKAAEFLSLQLENIRQTAADELEQAEQDAIQEVLKLNDLLQQRNKLEEDFKKQEFDLINQDAIERRKAGSVERGQQLAELRRQHDEQVKQLDEQIRLQTVKVDKEREVFNLSTDIEQLHRRDEELTLKALDAQISKWNDLKKLISSITMGADGIWSILPGILPGFGGATNFTIVNNFNGDIGGDPEEIGRQIGDSAYDEIMRRNRMVPSYA